MKKAWLSKVEFEAIKRRFVQQGEEERQELDDSDYEEETLPMMNVEAEMSEQGF